MLEKFEAAIYLLSLRSSLGNFKSLECLGPRPLVHFYIIAILILKDLDCMEINKCSGFFVGQCFISLL